MERDAGDAAGCRGSRGRCIIAWRGQRVQLKRITGLILIQKPSSVPSSKVYVISIRAEERDGSRRR